jgi:hypothetical protein
MMNAELVAAQEQLIIIPPPFRSEYLSGLRKLSLHVHADTYSRVMSQAQRWAASIDWSELTATIQYLHATNALDNPDDQRNTSYRTLIIPR